MRDCGMIHNNDDDDDDDAVCEREREQDDVCINRMGDLSIPHHARNVTFHLIFFSPSELTFISLSFSLYPSNR